MASLSGRFKELLKKYGKVALGVHCSVSAVSITGLYIAIKNNADVDALFAKLHLPGVSTEEKPSSSSSSSPSSSSSASGDEYAAEEGSAKYDDQQRTGNVGEEAAAKRKRAAELAASTGGALTLAILCNKALFPIRAPVTIMLTPPVAKFLARRKIIKGNVR
ncbi:uncharacterized protein LOC115728068 [Rhodamnia argentea]|uniref:Uncharacterized protein LOC115728068 n=1 Tax=Rhodamnia argentea TaxID=178133 RepID=A0A8B8MVX2_9MYRT|nr:uncharacterized protein LOC115728068 [Rhodamnia argentea]